MNRLPVLAALLLLGGLAHAQIEVSVKLDRAYFLPGEKLEVAVRVANFTGQPLTLGARRNWIRFTVEQIGGGVVNRLRQVDETGEFTLQHATAGTIRFDIMPQFALDKPGSYRVVAEVIPPGGSEIFTSAPANFDIVAGVRLNKDREVGVTLPDGTLVRRKFIVQQVNFLEKLQLYVRVTDASELQTLAVHSLGPVVSFDQPSWVIDRSNRFHVLHRFNASNYAYHVIETDGSIITRQTYRFTSSRPELRVNDEGDIAVIGGLRTITKFDLPPPRETEAPADNDTPPPAQTPTPVDAKDAAKTPSP